MELKVYRLKLEMNKAEIESESKTEMWKSKRDYVRDKKISNHCQKGKKNR